MPNLQKMMKNRDLQYAAAMIISNKVKDSLLNMVGINTNELKFCYDITVASMLQKQIYGQNNFKKLIVSLCINIILDQVVGPLIPRKLLQNNISVEVLRALMLLISLHLAEKVKSMEMLAGVTIGSSLLMKSGLLNTLPRL